MLIHLEVDPERGLEPLSEVLRRTEVAYLRLAVERIGHRGQTAAALGISRKNLWEKLRGHALTDLPKGGRGRLQEAASALGIDPERLLKRIEEELQTPVATEA